MRAMMIGIAASLAVTPVAASESANVMARVHQFIDGDTKTSMAACAPEAAIVDEFPPHEWQGPGACLNWNRDYRAYNKANGITDTIATIGSPRHVDITGDRAYVVVPATYTYKKRGQQVKESGSVFTVALRKGATGWRITGWAWAKN